MTDCVLCKYSILDFYDAEALFLRDIYCHKGNTTKFHIPFDELDQFKCDDYKISITTWILTHMIYFMQILFILLLLYAILRDIIGVI